MFLNYGLYFRTDGLSLQTSASNILLFVELKPKILLMILS